MPQWSKTIRERKNNAVVASLRTANRIISEPRYEYIFDFDWDLLVILDACRLDLMKEVQEQWSFITGISDIWSAGSSSGEWMDNTFQERYREEMASTAYVTANPWTDNYLQQESFAELREVWMDGWDDEAGTVPARTVTDHAIKCGRSVDADRFIVHYMQPHHPFIKDVETKMGSARVENSVLEGATENNIWNALEDGEVEKERVWRGYRANLHYVLKEVSLLLDNFDAEKPIITSDHGNALGEFGQYAHGPHLPLPCLRRVPWIETTAQDTGEYEPEIEETNGQHEVKRKLRDLGYLG